MGSQCCAEEALRNAEYENDKKSHHGDSDFADQDALDKVSEPEPFPGLAENLGMSNIGIIKKDVLDPKPEEMGAKDSAVLPADASCFLWSARPEDWESRVADVRELCQAVRLFDAHDALLKLEAEAGAANGADAAKALQDLQSNRLFAALKFTHTRLKAGFELMKYMGEEKDSRWGTATEGVPDIHADCKMEIMVRFLEEAERDPAGKQTQIIIVFKSHNVPAAADKQIALYAAMDKWSTEWEYNLKHTEAWCGGSDRLHSCLFRKHFKAPMALASENDIVVLRDFAVCPSGLLGLGPGVVVSGTPPDVDPSEGWTVPAEKPGLARTKSCSCDYIQPGDHADTCHISFVLKIDLPIPQWLVPMKLGLKILVNEARNTLRLSNVKCWSQFDKIPGMEERMKSMSDFMSAVQRLRSGPSEAIGA